MIPVLFYGSATTFTSNGIGRLVDAVSCEVNETLNGEYVLTMQYPIGAPLAKGLMYRRIIYAKANQEDDRQAFRICKVEKSLQRGMLTVTANHLSYDLSGFPVTPFSAAGAANAVAGLASNSMITQPFTFSTDITDTSTAFAVGEVRSIRNCIGGSDNSLLTTFGGELKFDNYDVSLLTQRGENRSVSIRYRKNLESFVNVESVEDTYSGMVSYYSSGGTRVIGNVVYPQLPVTIGFPTPKILIYDATSDFNSAPSVSDLDSFSSNYIVDNHIGNPYINTMTISFVPLWQTEEYKDLKEFETVALGDAVRIVYDGWNTVIRAYQYTYDVLSERYTKMVLGRVKPTLAQTIKQIV